MFSGPISESVPSGAISLTRRRTHTDPSVHSTYFGEVDDARTSLHEATTAAEYDDDFDPSLEATGSAGSSPGIRHARSSLEDPLLSRQESFNPFYSRQRAEHRLTQRIYIVTEDLTAVISGFSTSFSGLCIYILLCTLSFGTAYLVFRWLPKWRVRLIGSPTPLRQCQWVAIEVSNAFAVLKITWS